MKKHLYLCVSIVCIVSICAFFLYQNLKDKNASNVKQENEPESSDMKSSIDEIDTTGASNRSINTWTVYWDNEDILADMKELDSKVSSLSYFAAYFDANENLFIPDNMESTYTMVELAYLDTNYKSYLTFVNDVLTLEGGSSLKDTKLLYSLLSTNEDRERHVNEIIEMTLNGGYDGIEIDYEAIKKDKELWKVFTQFINDIYIKATEKGLSVRVLLEPSTPVEELNFIDGPEYVMMCYNLYGYGTEPGPKANKDSLSNMVEKMSIIPGKKGFAVANGGFDFAESGNVKQLTTKEAIKKQELYQGSSYRDKDSGCMVFHYADDLGIYHEVWYGDSITMNYWFDILEKLGEENLFLWRVGG